MISQYHFTRTDSASFFLSHSTDKMVLERERQNNLDGETCISNRLRKLARSRWTSERLGSRPGLCDSVCEYREAPTDRHLSRPRRSARSAS